MNIINKLTWRHMMKNKQRTLVTIIGVIISVAMITAVATLTSSFVKFAQNEHIATEGEWHVAFKDVDDGQLQGIQDDENSDQIIISRELGYADLQGSQNESKPYLFIQQFNDIGFQQFPTELISGRLPENDRELLISEHILTNGQVDLAIGDQLTLHVGDRVTTDEDFMGYGLGQTFHLIVDEEVMESVEPREQLEYTIVGIMERPEREPYFAPGYTVLSYVSEADVTGENPADALIVWDKVKMNKVKSSEKLGESLKIDEVISNEYLLRYYGISKHEFLLGAVYSVVAIIMTVIIAGSISLIYNAFAISVSERSRHLGMLSSVGATKHQKRNSILFEGAVIGIISIPLGILSGVGGIGLTLYFVNKILRNIAEFKVDLFVYVTPMTIIAAAVIAGLTIFISAFIPAMRASRISAIDAIRQAKDIQLTRKKVKTSRLVRRLFGMEAEIALKNLKRQKRRYYATVFSLVISIVLFLTVAFLSEQIRATSYLTFGDINYDLDIYLENGFDDNLMGPIKDLEDITELTQMTYTYLETELTEEQAHESLDDFLEAGKATVFVELVGLDEAALQAYAAEVGVDYDTLTDTKSLTGILINVMDTPGEKIGETTAVYMEPGDDMHFTYYDWEQDQYIAMGSIGIAGLTNQRPHGVSLSSYAHSLTMITSEDVLSELNDIYPIEIDSRLIISSSDPFRTHEQLEKIVDSETYIFNQHLIRQEEEGFILIMSVFTYGFITLITLISVANIFNTISTSVALRTREFGMLKSVGMTPKGFNRMINYESLFYGMQALLFGLPISFGIMFLIYREMAGAFDYPLQLPWGSIIGVIVGVFVIVGLAMLYSSVKVRKANIIDALKSENI